MKIWDWLLGIWQAFTGREDKFAEKADSIFDGYEGLNDRMQRWAESVEERLKECEQDRRETHNKLQTMEAKFDECERDRDENRRRIEALETKVS